MYIVSDKNQSVILSISQTAVELLTTLNVEVTDKGIVSVKGQQDTISYNMSEWNKVEIFRDLASKRLNKIAELANVSIFHVDKSYL